MYEAQLASIRTSRVKAMDETPIKAGRAGPGKLKSRYFWPVYGEHDEVCFPFFETRAHATVEAILGLEPVPDGVLLRRCCQRTGCQREHSTQRSTETSGP